VSADQIVLLAVGLIVIAAVAVTVAYATAHATRGGVASVASDPASSGLRDHDDRAADPTVAPATGTIRTGSTLVSPASTRQVARVVAFLFLASVAVVVALTHAWPETEAAIFTLLAAGMLLVVLFMDMVPPSALGRWRRPAEGVGAIVFLGLLMALTGGAGSPFLVGFFLVVAGTALSTEGRAPLAVALVGTVTIAVVGLLDALEAPLQPEALAWVGINAVALILLADIATAAARSQRHARDEALRASRFDALTGLYNRSFFFTTMEQEIRRSDRMGRGFTMLMLDLDDLKPVNDTFGHQWGDRLLKAIADTVRQTIRFTDAAARYGGDEFVVLLPETDVAGGYVVGEKLRRDVAALTLHAADRNVRSSVSVGLVTYPDDGTTIEQLVAAADVAMYEAKRRGKNRIVGYQTRTERVATAMDARASELVQLTPSNDVRTGGDPAPWPTASPEGGARVSYGEYPVNETRLEPPGRRHYDRSTIPVEPDEAAPAPWTTEAAPPQPQQPPPPPHRDPDPGSADEPPPPQALDRRDQPPEPQASTETGVGVAEHPWLTRTDDSPPGPVSQAPDDVRPGGAPPPPPPNAGPHLSSRGKYRSDEVRSTDERPWIALPIEPYDPPTDPPSKPDG
jgi:diguanylate cyclase (GGDEF)-like protein